MKLSLRLLTWLCRIVVGATFTFSGFVKGIDPWGTIYKVEDYMAAMHLPVLRNLILIVVFILCAYEFCIGIFLLTGSFRRSSPICAGLLMAFMLPLTLWIAIKNPVPDCGCFGDALLISNWATFWKNVVLTGAIAWLIKFNSRLIWIIRPHLQWIALIASALYTILIGLAGYIYQPLIDFRAYPVGEHLLTANDEEEDGTLPEYLLFYAKDGVERAFKITDELPSEEDGWTYIRREEVNTKPKDTDTPRESSHIEILNNDKKEEEKTFRIWSDDGEEDLTEDVIAEEGDQLILFMPDLGNVSVATTWQINSLYTWAKRNEIDMIGVVSGTPAQIIDWQDISLASYPIYTAEDTEIKMIVRGNPAVVFLRDGLIQWKTTLNALGTKDFQSSEISSDPMSFKRDNKAILYNISAIYLITMALLVGLSYITVLRKFFPSKGNENFNHDDKEGREESISPDKSAL